MDAAQWRRNHILRCSDISHKSRIATESGTEPERVLGLTIGRWIAGGVHEDIEITNNSMRRVSFQLEIAVRSDFAICLR